MSSPTDSRTTLLTAFALFALYVIWGSTYFAMHLALASVPPFLMASGRFFLAGGILFLILRLRGEAMPTLRQWRSCALVGLFLLVGGNGGVVFAQQWVTSSLAAVVVATMPLWAAFFSFLFGKRPARSDWLGLLLGFCGVLWLSAGGAFQAKGIPAAVLVFAPMSWAFGSVLSHRLDLPKGLMASAAQMLAASVFMLGISFALHEPLPRTVTTSSALSIAYLVVFGSLVAFSAYGYLLRHTRPAIATSYAYVNPIVALWLGVTFAHEPFTPALLGATLLIVVGVAIISLLKPKVPAAVVAELKEG
jgi:drug/metabolite transporter (DMT)-like permease